MFYIILLGIVWAIWLIFADKNRFKEISPISFLAGFIAGLADVVAYHYPLWDYNNSTIAIIPDITDNIGLYLVVTYLFIQWLPNKKSDWQIWRYFFIWTTITISIEWLHIVTGHLHYGLFWSIGWSYILGWMLFWIFYRFYKVLHPKKNSGT